MDLSGRRLGPYEISGHLGRGGVADVYRALHTGLSKEVALKVLFEESAEDAEQIARFQRESRVLARLTHPGIVEVYDCGNEGKMHYFAMQLLEHRTLGALLDIHAAAGGWLPEPQCLAIVSSILEVLAVVHAENIVHRDLKPSNIFVTQEDQAIVSDFGLVKVVDETSLTAHPDTVLGTIQYMAPEQILSEPADARTDLYAVGLVLYRMLYGQLPFGDQMAEVVQKKTLYAGFKPPAKPRRDASPALVAALERACRRDRRERFATAPEFLAALEPMLPENRVPSHKIPVIKRDKSVHLARATHLTSALPPRRRRFHGLLQPLAIAGAALAASVVVGLAVKMFALKGPPVAPLATPTPSAAAPLPADPRALAEAAEACRAAYQLMGSECYKVLITSVLAPDVERLKTCYEEDLTALKKVARRLEDASAALARSGALPARSALASVTLHRYLVSLRQRGVIATRQALQPHRSGTLSQEGLARLQPVMTGDSAAFALLARHADEIRELALQMARQPERVESEAGRLADDVRELARLASLLTWTTDAAAATRDHLRVLPELASRAPAPVGPALAAALSSIRTAALNSKPTELTRAMARATIEDLAALRALFPASAPALTPAFTEAWRDLDRARP